MMGMKPATKADIKSLRGGRGFETLEGRFKKLDDKIDSSVKRLAVEIVKTNARMDSMEERLTRKMDESQRTILAAIDRFVKRDEAYERATVVHGRMLTEHGDELKQHRQRLSRLESGRA